MIKIFLGILALWPIFVFAETTPNISTTYCASSVFIGIKIKNSEKFPTLHCSDLQSRFENAFKDVQNISPVKITGPMLIVYNFELSRGSTYSWVTSTMTVDLGDLNKFDQQIAVFYHEMGHKIYYEYFSKMVPEVAAKKTIISNYAEYLSRCDSMAPPPEASCLSSNAPSDLDTASHSFSKDFDKFYYMATPYNELFADIVASLASGNQDAIANALGPCTNSNPACEYRSFSKNTVDMFAGTNPYSRLSPIRRDLWDSFIEPRLNNKQEILDELATTFLNDTITYYQEDSKKIEGMQAIAEIKRLTQSLDLHYTTAPTLVSVKY
jgi:hypothetical protein